MKSYQIKVVSKSNDWCLYKRKEMPGGLKKLEEARKFSLLETEKTWSC